jgi:hypothetical protein
MEQAFTEPPKHFLVLLFSVGNSFLVDYVRRAFHKSQLAIAIQEYWRRQRVKAGSKCPHRL